MRSKSARFVFFRFLVLVSFSLIACQPPNVDAPALSVNNIAFQDNALWLCRLARLDLTTNTFEKLDRKSYDCDHIFVAQNGWVWAYDEHGLQYYHGQTWHDPKVYTRDQGDLNAVTETRDGTIWISSSILTRYDPRTDQATVIVPPQPTPTPKPDDSIDILGGVTGSAEGYIGPILEAADGSFWFNRPFQDVVRWDPVTNSIQSWGPDDGFDGFSPKPTKFIQSRDGDIWMGTDRGLYHFRNGQWYHADLLWKGSPDLGDFVVMDILEDTQGRIWTAYNHAGVTMWDGNSRREIGGFAYDQPRSLFEDSSGAIWIGFNGRGTVKYENGERKSYPTHVTAFLETPDHRLFGGSGGEGLFLYNRASDQWEKYPSNK